MLKRSPIYIFLMALALIVASLYLYRTNFKRTQDYVSLVDRTHSVLVALEELSRDFKAAQLYSTRAARDREVRALYHAEMDSIDANLDRLHDIIVFKRQESRIDSIRVLFAAARDWMIADRPNDQPFLLDGNRQRDVASIERTIEEAKSYGRDRLVEQKFQLEEATDLMNAVILSLIAVSGVLVVVAFGLFLKQTQKREQAESFLQLLLDTSPVGIILYRPIWQNSKVIDFRVEYANNGVTVQSQTELEQMLKQTLIKQAPGNEIFLDRFVKVLTTGEPDEYDVDYGHAWYRVSLNKLDDAVLTSFFSITALKTFEAELHRKIHQLQHSNQELEQYAYVTSHDLQEPLRKIRTFLDMVLSDKGNVLTSAAERNLDKVLSSAERMTYYIQKLLEYARVSRSLEDLEPVDLNDVVQQVLTDFELRIQQVNATVHRQSLVTLEASRFQMEQLFSNLISNALKFAREGQSPRISINVDAHADVNHLAGFNPQLRYFAVRVTDNGIGFDPVYAEKIFQLFQRLNGQNEYPGAGIGLAICKKIAVQHQGSITVRSEPGRGSTFIVYLPYTQRYGDEAEIPKIERVGHPVAS